MEEHNPNKITDSHVFVSYSHSDAKQVLAEIGWLREKGINVYFDAGISPGSEWSDELARAIKQCSAFLYFVTPRSVASENCRREVNFAIAEGRKILAVHLENTEVPDGLRLNLENRQSLHKSKLSKAEYRDKLLGALSDRSSSSLSAPPRKAVGLWHKVLAGLAIVVALGFITAQWIPPSATNHVPVERSVFVAPFENLGNSELERKAAKLSQEVQGLLSNYAELRVVIGDSGQQSYELKATLSGKDDVFKVQSDLIRIKDRETVWSASYESDSSVEEVDLLIARNVRQEITDLQPGLTTRTKTANRREQRVLLDVAPRHDIAEAFGQGLSA